MKKNRSIFVSSMLFALALASCSGENGYYGTYQFQMGKVNESHIGIYMDLTKDKIEVDTGEKKEQMEKFSIKLSIPEGASPEGSLIGGVLTYFQDGLQGGYKIEKIEGSEEDMLTLAPVFDISGLVDMVNDGEGEEEGSSSSDPESSSSEESSSSQSPITIPADVVEDILIAKYNKNSIEVTVPVSLTDLMLQLYWYGFDIFDLMEEYPIKEHAHGTHPTAEDIAEINKTFNSDDRMFKHYDIDALVKYKSVFKVVEFRDFNQLTMTLTKAVIK